MATAAWFGHGYRSTGMLNLDLGGEMPELQ